MWCDVGGMQCIHPGDPETIKRQYCDYCPPATAAKLANCWTCAHSGSEHNDCLKLDDKARSKSILLWLASVQVMRDGTVPHSSDGCPDWEVR